MNMNFYKKLLAYKAVTKGVTWNTIGEVIDMDHATIRMAVTRESLNKLQIRELENHFKMEKEVDFNDSDKNIIDRVNDKFKDISIDEVARFIAINKDEMLKNEFFKEFVNNIGKDIAIDILAKKIGNSQPH